MKHFFLALFLFATLVSLAQKDYQPTDQAVTVPMPYDYSINKKYKGQKYSSFYLTMRDGNKIAVEVYLPKGLKEGEKVPAIMHQTRYWRSFAARWPFSMFMGNMFGVLEKFKDILVSQGYALVNVDSRGSGASYGFRPYPWYEDEVKDGYEIAEWIVQQPWSSGVIGSAGASYSGTTSEFLLTTHHPAVKAVVNMYSLFDVYEDNAFPGGLHNVWFTSIWGHANTQLDRNEIPTKNKVARMAVKGVRPVQGKKRKKMLHEAIASHVNNRNVNDGALKVTFRDDNVMPDMGEDFSVDVFSPHSYLEKEDKSGAAVYSYSGWSDGSYQHAAIKRFLSLSNPDNKLIIGPWEHGGSFNTSPFNPGPAGFDHMAEILKFFDYHLKGIENSLAYEPRVHYFTLGEEKWKSSTTWPPKRSEYQRVFFRKDNQVRWSRPLTMEKPDTYKVDTLTGTGSFTRYESVAGQLRQPVTYPDRNERDKLLLVYEADEAFVQNTEVTGHPIANLYISADAEDLQLIVYLEDVDTNGHVTYVTEGMLRAVHRKINNEEALYEGAVPYRTFEKEDAMPLVPGEICELVFDFLPISYQFKEGHKIRLSIAGHDKDHFRNIYTDFDKLPTITLYHDKKHPSSIDLPIFE